MNANLSDIDTALPPQPIGAGCLHLRLFTDFDAVRDLWCQMEATSLSTVYQTLAWCETWMTRVGKPAGIRPLIVVAEDGFGQCAFILPLQLRTWCGFKIVEALATPQTAYGFGLFSMRFLLPHGADWFESQTPRLVACLPPHDVFSLKDLPYGVAGCTNPLLGMRSFAAANRSHVVHLRQDFDTFLAEKRSSDSLRTIRKRDAKLTASGTVNFDLPRDAAARLATLDVMFEQQDARLSEFGIHQAYSAVEKDFIRDMASLSFQGEPLLRPYRLTHDGKIVSVMLGAWHRNTYWALISSLADGDIRHYSPGDFALRAMLKALCEAGGERLDFSTGDTAYKLHWSDETVKLDFVLRASTLKGLVLASYLFAREKTKRIAKQTPWLHAMLFRARQKLAGH
jgi:CelD/BcsL family acetyltransferase involved in cellulose biosynthesis